MSELKPPYIHPTAIVDEGAHLEPGVKIWHFVHVMPGTHIGERTQVGQNCYIDKDVRIGKGCKLQNNVSVYNKVTLEDDVFCGPSMVFTNVNEPRAFVERKAEFAETLIKRGATLGANCTIVCGSTVGEYSFIGAGAVVTKDVPAYALMVGVPAKRIGWVSRLGRRLGADLTCPESGERYEEVDGVLKAL